MVYPRIQTFSFLTEFGHEVEWVIGLEGSGDAITFDYNGVKVHAIPHRHYLPGKSIFARIPNRIIHSICKMKATLKVFREGDFNLLYYRPDVGLLDGFVTLLIRRKYGIPLVIDLQNPLWQWDVLKVSHGLRRPWRFLVAKFDEWLGMHLVNAADFVFTISAQLHDNMVNSGKYDVDKIMAIPAGADVEIFSLGDGSVITREFGLEDAKVVIYEGSIGKGRKLGILFEAFAMVSDEIPEARLLVVGSGDAEDDLKRLAAEIGLREKVIFIGQVPQSRVPDYINAADIGVCPVPPLDFYKFSSPIKIFEYMAAGKPIIANEEIPEQRDGLEKSGGGILVPWKAEAFAWAMKELLKDKSRALEMGQKGREWVCNNRSLIVMARQVEKKYSDLLRR